MQLLVHDYLDALGIPYTTGSFPPTTAKGAAEVAKALAMRRAKWSKHSFSRWIRVRKCWSW